MDKRLTKQLISILAMGIDGRIKSELGLFESKFGVFKDSEEYSRAYRLLSNSHYMIHKSQYGSTTLVGLDYMERLRESLKHPARLWLKDNWFPAIVAAATIFLALGSVVVQVVGLILD